MFENMSNFDPFDTKVMVFQITAVHDVSKYSRKMLVQVGIPIANMTQIPGEDGVELRVRREILQKAFEKGYTVKELKRLDSDNITEDFSGDNDLEF